MKQYIETIKIIILALLLAMTLISTSLLGACGKKDNSDSETNIGSDSNETIEEFSDSSTVDSAKKKGYVIVTDYISANSGKDISTKLQILINQNPNKTIYFPDGEYIIKKPITTPANPSKAVSLELSNFAVIKADSNWTHKEAMIRLGAAEPYNDINTNGSNYYISGGVIDGNGVANGIAIESGRETSVRNVSIKHTKIGLHIKYGANSGSSDADINNVNIVGNNKEDSIGVLVEGYDNTLSNMRIAGVKIGVKLTVGGNYLSYIHPLFIFGGEANYKGSTAFWDFADNRFSNCYSDQFETGFLVGNGSIYDTCTCYWYTDKGEIQRGFWSKGEFNSLITQCKVSFRYDNVKNIFIEIDRTGGNGIIEYPIFDVNKNSDLSYLPHLVGKVLPY